MIDFIDNKNLNMINNFNFTIFFGDYSIKLLLLITMVIYYSGALGQTRTGTPKKARILSPLCLPISPRGH